MSFDTSVLARMAEQIGNVAVGRVVSLFNQDAAARIRSISEMPQSDAAGLARAAHALKGSATAIGAIELGEIASSIEKDALAGDFSRVSARIAELPEALVRATEEISAFRLSNKV